MSISWDILITSIPHRHTTLCELLEELSHQIYPGGGVGVRLYRDNLETQYGDKTQKLMDSSAADYISCIDDDDLVAADFVSRVMRALVTRPDYVGFPVRWTRNNILQAPVHHSLEFGSWSNDDDMLRRDITQFNPIRRELARLGEWSGGWQAERRWAEAVRSSGQAATQVWIPDPMYYYRENEADTFTTTRETWSEPLPELPSYPWLIQVGS